MSYKYNNMMYLSAYYYIYIIFYIFNTVHVNLMY